MVANVGKPFWGILGWPFLGDVLEKCPIRFGEMEQNRLQQTDGPNVGEAVCANSWMAVSGGCFGKIRFPSYIDIFQVLYISSITYN